MRRAGTGAALLVLAVTACAAPDDRRPSADSRDVTEWRLSEEPLLTIGYGDDPRYALHQVGAVRTLSSGALAVPNGQQEVRLFSAEGAYLRTLGREGEGPGEFVQLFGVYPVPGDSLFAYNTFPPRAHLFGPEGEFHRSISFETQAWPMYRLEDGSWIGRRLDEMRAPEMTGTFEWKGSILRFSETGELTDTLATVTLNRLYGDRTFSRGIPFGPSASTAVGPDGVYVSEGEEYRVEVLDPVTGEIVGVVRRDEESDAIPDAVVDAYLDDLREALARPSREFPRRYAPEDLPIPEHYPAITGLRVSEDGDLWVRRYSLDSEPARWDVFSDGELVARVTTPDRLQVTEIGGDYVLGVWTDELDVQTVRMFRIER